MADDNLKVEHINCDYCGHDDTDLVVKQTDLIHRTTKELFLIVRCKKCGLAYTNPRPKKEYISNYYSDNYSFHSNFSWYKRIMLSMLISLANSRFPAFLIPSLISRRMSRYVMKKIKDPVREFISKGGGGTLLDIGCGSGQYAHYWGSNGALLSYRKFVQVYGVDISQSARNELRDNDIEAWKNIDDVPGAHKYSVIRMNWSLEHVYSPSKYFKFVNDHLQDDGIVVIGLPNYDGIIYKIDKHCVELPVHLYHYTPGDIKNYADRFGLEIIKLETFSYPQMFLEASRLGMFPVRLPDHLSLEASRTIQKLLNIFDENLMGNDMVIVMKKVHANG